MATGHHGEVGHIAPLAVVMEQKPETGHAVILLLLMAACIVQEMKQMKVTVS